MDKGEKMEGGVPRPHTGVTTTGQTNIWFRHETIKQPTPPCTIPLKLTYDNDH